MFRTDGGDSSQAKTVGNISVSQRLKFRDGENLPRADTGQSVRALAIGLLKGRVRESPPKFKHVDSTPYGISDIAAYSLTALKTP